MIPFEYSRLARQIHEERIQAALRPRPEFTEPRTPCPSRALFVLGWPSGLLAHWPAVFIARVASRRL